jgi:hypothetical protein
MKYIKFALLAAAVFSVSLLTQPFVKADDGMSMPGMSMGAPEPAVKTPAAAPKSVKNAKSAKKSLPKTAKKSAVKAAPKSGKSAKSHKSAKKAASKNVVATKYECAKCHMIYSAADAKKCHFVDPMDGGKLNPIK